MVQYSNLTMVRYFNPLCSTEIRRIAFYCVCVARTPPLRGLMSLLLGTEEQTGRTKQFLATCQTSKTKLEGTNKDEGKSKPVLRTKEKTKQL